MPNNLVKVTVNLTESDLEMTDDITEALRARSKASAISFALMLAWQAVNILSRDREARLVIEKGNGDREYLVLPSLRAVPFNARVSQTSD